MTHPLPFRVHREVVIHARPDTVFAYLSDPERFAAWWGAGSSIAARPGGALHIAYPNGQSADGEVLEVDPGKRIRFTYGYDRPDTPIPVGGSVVEITLEPVFEGTLVRLTHDVESAAARDQHDPGWRYQLGLFAAVVVRARLAPRLAERLRAYTAAWNEADPDRRRSLLAEVVADGVTMTDGMARIRGRDELDDWIDQSRRVMPGTRIAADGDPALAGDRALWDWVLAGPDGAPLARGRNVARFDLDGAIAEVTGFWLDAPPGVPTATVR